MTNISIPTAARGLVRAFVKALPGFDAWIEGRGLDSRDVKNADLVAYAEEQGFLDDVLAIIDSVKGQSPNAIPTAHDFYAAVDALVVNAKIDAVIEAQIDADLQATVSTFTLEQVLGNVADFLSPLVRKELEKVLQPLVVAANKPAVVNTVEKIVHVPAAPVAPAGKAPYAVKTGKSVEFAKLFGVRTTHAFGKAPISLWNAHGQAPAIDQFYVIDAKNMGVLATAAERETNVWLVGPTGSGKTTMPQQFCAYTGRPFVKIGFTRQTEVADLTGGQALKAGNTEWDDGVLIQAMKSPGTCILLDEISFAPAGVNAIIQGASDDHRTYTIHATGEVVHCAPGVFFVVADNTNGSGDESGQYAGTNPANAALVNRFKRMVRVDYMTKAQETSALMNHIPGLPQPAAEHVADFMNRVRKLPEMEGIAMSLRQMVGFIETVKDGFTASDAFEVAILTRLPATERAAVETMATLQWSEQFEQLLNGSTASTEVSSTPDNTPAANAFDDEVSSSFSR